MEAAETVDSAVVMGVWAARGTAARVRSAAAMGFKEAPCGGVWV